MDLLLEIKKFYELLPTHTEDTTIKIEKIEEVAEAVFNGKWKILTNEIKIGYTNETMGIYSNLPCIIFDDFTTDSKLVNFPFKVKSSAMKILQVRTGIEIEYVSMFMSVTRLIGDTHKRYWISEYSKLDIPIPPLAEQRRIVDAINVAFAKLEAIMESL